MIKGDITEREIEENSERFSPNVLLRPLYQECVLPNIATIGGGAEVAYWLQLKSMFDAQNVVFPMLVIRKSYLSVKNLEKKISLIESDYQTVLSTTEDVFTKQFFAKKAVNQSISVNKQKSYLFFF